MNSVVYILLLNLCKLMNSFAYENIFKDNLFSHNKKNTSFRYSYILFYKIEGFRG